MLNPHRHIKWKYGMFWAGATFSLQVTMWSASYMTWDQCHCQTRYRREAQCSHISSSLGSWWGNQWHHQGIPCLWTDQLIWIYMHIQKCEWLPPVLIDNGKNGDTSSQTVWRAIQSLTHFQCHLSQKGMRIGNTSAKLSWDQYCEDSLVAHTNSHIFTDLQQSFHCNWHGSIISGIDLCTLWSCSLIISPLPQLIIKKAN